MVVNKLRSATEIADKWLAGELITRSGALEFFNCVRMSIESFGFDKTAPTLKSYCDLLFHERLDRRQHFGFLVSISDALRINLINGDPVSPLYGQVFAFDKLRDELSEFYENVHNMEVLWLVASKSAELFHALFENFVDHSISLGHEYPFSDESWKEKRRRIFGADTVHVIKIDFGMDADLITARLHVMDVIGPQTLPLIVEIPVKLTN